MTVGTTDLMAALRASVVRARVDRERRAGLVCELCGTVLEDTPWGPVAVSVWGSGPCRPIDAEAIGADDDGLHVAVGASS